MPKCRDIEPLVTAYVDGEANAGERETVASHLDACAPCRADAAREATARTVVRSRAAALAPPPAPPFLRARVMSQSSHVRRTRGMLPWAIAASMLAAAVLLFTLTTRSTTVLAAQLAVDHVKCFEFPGTPNSDAHALEASLANRFGWHVVIPPGSVAAGLTLLTARRCLYADGKIAHVMYKHHNRNVSLFVLPSANRRDSGRLDEVKVMGHEAVIWSSNRQAYVLIGREPRAELEQLAAYVRESLPR